jgi:hypothetical protein
MPWGPQGTREDSRTESDYGHTGTRLSAAGDLWRRGACDPQSPPVGILLQYHQGDFCGRAWAGCAFVCLGRGAS